MPSSFIHEEHKKSLDCDPGNPSRLPFDEILIFMLRWCFDKGGRRRSDDSQADFLSL